MVLRWRKRVHCIGPAGRSPRQTHPTVPAVPTRQARQTAGPTTAPRAAHPSRSRRPPPTAWSSARRAAPNSSRLWGRRRRSGALRREREEAEAEKFNRETEFNENRIKQFKALRRGLIRTRSYFVIGAAGCVGLAAQLVYAPGRRSATCGGRAATSLRPGPLRPAAVAAIRRGGGLLRVRVLRPPASGSRTGSWPCPCRPTRRRRRISRRSATAASSGRGWSRWPAAGKCGGARSDAGTTPVPPAHAGG